MRLTDLHPKWVGVVGDPRHGMGISFDCPACPGCYANEKADPWEDAGGTMPYRIHVLFENPVDGGDPAKGNTKWKRTGTTFNDLTLSPSIDGSHFGHWHGHVVNGEIK